jgi:hypothetical protein
VSDWVQFAIPHCCKNKECNKPLEKHTYPNGTVESDTQFNIRQYCNNKCKGNARKGIILPAPERYCQNPNCGKRLHRHKCPGGHHESIPVFLKRKYCNWICRDEALEEIHKYDEISNRGYHRRARHCGPEDGLCQICRVNQWKHVHCPNKTLDDIKDLSNNKGMYLCEVCHDKAHGKRRYEHCKIEGCDRPHEALELCKIHYTRYLRNGDPTIIRHSCCSVSGCNNPHEALTLCKYHYNQWYKHGDPLWSTPTPTSLPIGVTSICVCATVEEADMRSEELDQCVIIDPWMVNQLKQLIASV